MHDTTSYTYCVTVARPPETTGRLYYSNQAILKTSTCSRTDRRQTKPSIDNDWRHTSNDSVMHEPTNFRQHFKSPPKQHAW